MAFAGNLIHYVNHGVAGFCRLLIPAVHLIVPSLRKEGKQLELTINSRISHIESVPDPLLRALVLVEDRRFFEHGGFEIIGILRAFISTIVFRRIQGASTIEQQLVRVLTNRRERTIARKIREIIHALRLSQLYSKDEIATLYLDIAYYGAHMNGLSSAMCQLRISRQGMSIYHAAQLIARLKYPEPAKPLPRRSRQIDVRVRHIVSQFYGIEPQLLPFDLEHARKSRDRDCDGYSICSFVTRSEYDGLGDTGRVGRWRGDPWDSVSSSPSSNRACEFPAHGSRSSLDQRRSRFTAWLSGAALPGNATPKGALVVLADNRAVLLSVQ